MSIYQTDGFLYHSLTINDRESKKALVSLKNNSIIVADLESSNEIAIELSKATSIKRVLPQDEAPMFKVINEKLDKQDESNLVTSVHYFRLNTQEEAEEWLEAIEQYIEDCELINKLDNEQERQLHTAVVALKFPMQFIEPDHIEIRKKIGSGGFGTVYNGSIYGSTCAVKVLHNQVLSEHERYALLNEIQACNSVRHPNILLFLGACIKGRIMLITELMAGSLDRIFNHPQDWKNLPLEFLLRMVQQGALGLAWLHSHTPTIIHHDIKPENFLYDDHFRVVLADFGLAKLVRGGKGWGSFQGTVLWSAPEKLVELDFTEKCDIYSLGLCIWSAIERTSPYSELFGVTDGEFIQKIKFDNYRPKFKSPLWNHRLINIVESCWNDNGDLRPSAETVAKLLDEIAHIGAIQDERALAWWNTNFQDNNKVVVSQLLNSLECPDNFNKKMLMMLLVESATKSNLCVSDIDFGKVLSTFGPFDYLCDNVSYFCIQKWFFGSVSKRKIVAILNKSNQPGSYLVRLLDSKKGSFAINYISTVTNKIEQKTILREFDTYNNSTYTLAGEKEDQDQYNTIEELIFSLKLSTPAQSSAFYENFGNQFFDWGEIEYIE